MEDRFRYVLLVIGFLCLTSISSNYIIINFTFICQKEDFTDAITTENGVCDRQAHNTSILDSSKSL